MPRIHLGINTCFAVKRWPEPSDWAAIVRDDLGLSTVQMSTDLLPVGSHRNASEQYTHRLADATSSFGLDLHSFFTGLGAYTSGLLLSDAPTDRLAAFEWYRSLIELTALAGARGVGGHLGALSVPVAADQRRRSHLLGLLKESMRELSLIAADFGLDHLQFENLAVAREYGHSIPEAHDLEDSLDGTPIPWVLCLDLGHPAAMPEDSDSGKPGIWLRESWRRPPIVQLQQSPRGADAHGAFTAANNRVGTVDRDDTLAAIAQWNADDVYLFFEIIHANEADDSRVLDELRESVEFWKEGIAAMTAKPVPNPNLK